MDKRNLQDEMSSNKLEAIHLLPKIDVKSVKNYMVELLSLYHIKNAEFTAECLICASLLKSWQNLVQHLRNPSHIYKIKEDSKQFTAFCIKCKYILIADNADFIFEHFILHRAATIQRDKQTVQKSFDNDPTILSSNINSSTSIYKDDKNIDTNLIKYKHEDQMKNKYFNNEDAFGNIKRSAPERHKSVLTDNFIKQDIERSAMISSNVTSCISVTKSTPAIFNDIQELGGKLLTENHPDLISQNKNTKTLDFDGNDYELSRQPKLGVNFRKTSSKESVATSCQKLIYSSSIGVSPLQKDMSNESIKITSQNVVSESYKNNFYPKKAFFSNTTLQLISPGVSMNEFTVSQELNTVNLSDYCTKTYYSSYYRLRKLNYSCLDCNVLRLQEKDFYKHLIGVKHYNNLGECYGTGFIKICDICKVLLFGHIDLIKEHFQCTTHKQNIKCKMGLIKQQFAVISGEIKLGFSGKLTDRCTTLFSSKEAVNSWVGSSLKEAREVASSAVSLLSILERDINETLTEKYSNFCVKVVGSRLYELANHGSDVDIHLSIGDVSVGDLVIYFHKATRLFEVTRTILDAKVPIIRIKHLQSSLICDINTTNPSGPYCSELIKYVLNSSFI
ncbi:unnamed protein product [Nezara viridula]|uniref:Poly(A) RNA polymerase mitochondrial-like central palm domain-containing protein n=1 Tax=Nezara viridula TaxID=85310 RepID=A0A9P0HIT0_NEZVI|nr:unnamed protein product [Nezara viridula]